MPPNTRSLAPTVKFSRAGSANPHEGVDNRDALPAGTRLAEFELLCVLGTGGFGIVYLALDHALLRQVAIKEYMPGSLAVRGAGSWVAVRSPQHAETFAAGLKSFVNEAQLLASFDHPSLLKVLRFWEEHGTAYMVMPYYPGPTLKQRLVEMGDPPGEPWLRALAAPLLDALEVLHRAGVYHRDVSPDNILMQLDGPPVLLDFGAARRVVGEQGQALTAILKPSFAPVEQYADIVGMRQGAWTDLYAVAAVLYYVIRRQPPVPAAARAVRDTQPPLAEDPGELSAVLVQAIDWALAVAPEDRPQNVAQMRDALSGRLKRPQPLPGAVDVLSDPPRPRKLRVWRAGLATAVVAVVLGLAWGHRLGAAPKATAVAKAPAPTPIPAAASPAPAARPAVSPQSPRPEAAKPGKPAPAAAKPSKPTPTPAAAKPPATPKSPDEACSGLGFFRKAFCMNRECASARFEQHPQCVKQRRDSEASQRERERNR
ncbi:MAG TPA: serine/threonine-protein kinase [Rhizobacter sp.]|nr:serine/threonine-protein kinase [Rhizobacter sp.]